jgi:small basic protein (TIGR04137 family)
VDAREPGEEQRVSIHKSLVAGFGVGKHRNVLTRRERLAKLGEQARWAEDRSVFGIPKVRSIKVAAKKGPKKPKAAMAAVEGAAGTPEGAAQAAALAKEGAAQAGAASGKAAAPGKGAPSGKAASAGKGAASGKAAAPGKGAASARAESAKGKGA